MKFVLIRMQFHQAAGAKVRAALVVLDTGDDDFVAAPITSQARHSEYGLAMEDWRTAGLNVASYVRAHKLTVLAEAAGGESSKVIVTGLEPGDMPHFATDLCDTQEPDFRGFRGCRKTYPL